MGCAFRGPLQSSFCVLPRDFCRIPKWSKSFCGFLMRVGKVTRPGAEACGDWIPKPLKISAKHQRTSRSWGTPYAPKARLASTALAQEIQNSVTFVNGLWRSCRFCTAWWLFHCWSSWVYHQLTCPRFVFVTHYFSLLDRRQSEGIVARTDYQFLVCEWWA